MYLHSALRLLSTVARSLCSPHNAAEAVPSGTILPKRRTSKARSAGSKCWLAFPLLASLALLLVRGPELAAQTASFRYSASATSYSDGLDAIDVDSAGIVYYASSVGHINKYTLDNSTVENIFSISDVVMGLAIDAHGNIFVADPLSSVYEYTPNLDGSYSRSEPIGNVNAMGLVLDSSGNLYILSLAKDEIDKYPLINGRYSTAAQTIYSKYSTSIPSGGSVYSGILAVDPDGSVFASIYDSSPNGFGIYRFTPSGNGSYSWSTIRNGDGATEYSLAVGTDHSLYAVDQNSTSGNILKYAYADGSYSSTATTFFTGNQKIDTLHMNGHDVLAYGCSTASCPIGVLQTSAVNMGTAAVHTTKPNTRTLTFDVTGAGDFGTPTVLTQGAPNLDFAIVAAGTTCTGNLSSGSTCTVKVSFTPKFPGQRMGAVELVSTTGSVVATVPVYGMGTGPQISILPGAITTMAGGGTGGDGNPATSAQLNQPTGVAADGAGNLFIADSGNNRIRKVDLVGTISTVAGGGTGGDGGAAISAKLTSPNGVAVDGAGNLYIADSGNNRIRKVNAAGTITTVAGGGMGGDGGAAISAKLTNPSGVAVDGAGNLYIADSGNNRIRKVNATGIITTVAGGGTGGDGSAATSAQLNQPTGVAVDGAGNIYIADASNNRIRKVDAAGTITTVAGGGTGVDGDPATSAALTSPSGVAVDGAGNLYIADASNNRIRKVSAATGIITTVAGTGAAGYDHDNVVATSAQLNQPTGVAVDGTGNLYIADTSNNRIRKVSPLPPTLSFPGAVVGNDSTQTVTVANTGNAALSVQSVNVTGDFSQSTTCSSTLPAGEECAITLDFQPTSTGNYSGTVVVADNSLNESNSTQTVTLSGVGLLGTSTLASNISRGYSNSGQSFVLSALVWSNADGTRVTSGTVRFTVANLVDITGALDSSGEAVVPFSIPAGTAAGSYTIDAVFTPATGTFYASSSDSTHKLSISKGTLTVTWPTAYVYAGQTLDSGGFSNGSASFQGELVPGVFSFNSPATTPVSGNSYAATFTPTDSVDYIPATASVAVTVLANPLSITNVGTNHATLQIASDATGVASFTVLQGYNAACGTPAQVTAGQDSTGATAYQSGSLPVSSNATGISTVRNLMQSSPYTACLSVAGGPVARTSFATTDANGNAWVPVGAPGLSAGASSFESLAFNSQNTPYLAYHDGSNNTAMVMKFDGTNWTPAGALGSSAQSDGYESLAISAFGMPYLAYSDRTIGGRATVMTFDGTSWNPVGMPGISMGPADYESLAINPVDGTFYLTYSDQGNNGKATVMTFDDISWNPGGTPGISMGPADYESLALSTYGTPYLAYSDQGNNGKATVMTFDGTSWNPVGTPGFSMGPADYESLALNLMTNTAYLAYSDQGNNGKATVMTFDGTSWNPVGTPGFSAGKADYVSLAVSQYGKLYLAYSDLANGGKATVMTFDGTSWNPVGAQGFSAGEADYESLKITTDGTPYLAYSDQANGGKATVLKLVRLPVATTNAATNLSGTAATLNGTVNGNTLAASVSFEYGTTAAYGTTVAATTGGNIAPGAAATAVAVDLSGLAPSTEYHFRVDATTGSGMVYGEDQSFTTGTATPVVVWPTASAITYGQMLGDATLTGGSASYNGSPVAGAFAFANPATKPAAGIASYPIVFAPTDSTNYDTVTNGSVSVTTNPAAGAIGITNLPANAAYGGSFTPTYNYAGDGIASVTSSTLPVCTVSAGGTVIFVGVGTCTLTASATAGTNYAAATGSAQSFPVAKATPTAIWPTASSITYGQTLGNATLSGGSASYNGAPVTGNFAFNNPATKPTAGTASYPMSFSPTDSTNYNTVTNGSVSVTTNPAAGAIGITNLPANAVYGGSFTPTYNYAGDGTASVTSGTPQVCTVSGGTVNFVGAGSCTLTASATAGANYAAATGSAQSFAVAKATPTVIWPTASSITSGQKLADAALTGGSASYNGLPVAGTFAFATPTSMPGEGTASYAMSFAPTDTADYNMVSGTVSVTTLPVSPSGSFTLASSGTTTSTVIPGGAASFGFTMTPTGGTFPNAVSFSVTGLPAGATASFSPSAIAAGSPATAVTMTVQTARTAAHNEQGPNFGKGAPYALALILLPLAGVRRMRKQARRWMALLLVLGGLAITTALTGCGGGYFTQGSKSYSLTVTATSGSTSQSTQFMLNIE